MARMCDGQENALYPDTLVGTDSHTTMINGLGVVGWGVGGIEAEAVMLGQPIYMLIPEVVGMKLHRQAPRRRHRHRPGAPRHRDPARPWRGRPLRGVPRPGPREHARRQPRHHRQHGARIRRDHGLLPRGRADAQVPAPHRPRRKLIETVEQYCKEQGLWRDDTRQPNYTDSSSSTSARSSRAWPAPSGRRTASTSRR